MANYRPIGKIVEISRIGTEELSIEWQIQDILLLPGGRDDWYTSRGFGNGASPWFLRLCPKSKNDTWNPASGWMCLQLYRCYEGPPKSFHIRVGIRGSTGVEKEREVEREFSYHSSYVWEEFCSRFALIELKSRLMVEDRLIITCTIREVAPASARGNGESSMKRKFLESGGAYSLPCKKMQGMKEAMQDFGKLLASEEDTDVTLQVGDVEFRVHRLILSARSPVFSAMFKHNTAERASKKVIIEDCEPEVFKVYLQYLYSGSIQSLTEQNMFRLYQIADRYLADNLKLQCLEHIHNKLSVQTFYDTLQLALVHGESGLLEKAFAFASENIFLDSFYFKQNLLA